MKSHKKLQAAWNNPKFQFFKAKGIFPNTLFFGYENEVELKESESMDCDKVAEKIINKYPYLYAKEEESLFNGCEFNTHPFNYNWFTKKDLGYLKDIKKHFYVTRECGFHVHLSRQYFSCSHIIKMIKLFYGYPKFIKKISLRNKDAFKVGSFCSPDINIEGRYENFIKTNILYDNLERYFIENIRNNNYKSLTTCKFIYEFLNKNGNGHDFAINLDSEETIEIRIFQGTINKNLIKVYLQICLAIALYTKKTAFRDICPDNFIKYVQNNEKIYGDLIRSGILVEADFRSDRTYFWKAA